MFNQLSRRLALKILGLGAATLGLPRSSQAAAHTETASFKSNWHTLPDRVWLGEDVWANPMEDWRINDGAAESRTSGGNRNIHLLTHQLTNAGGRLEMSVELEQVKVEGSDSGAGFRLGIRSDINEYRSNCFAKGGIDAGISGTDLMLGDAKSRINTLRPTRVKLHLSGAPDGDGYGFTLKAFNESGNELGSVTTNVARNALRGNVALVNNFDVEVRRGRGTLSRFRDWSVGGDAFTVNPSHRFGPILWSMYSLSDSRSDEGFVMKLSALTGPLGEGDNRDIELLVQRDGSWESLGFAPLDRDAWTATFRIAQWNEKAATPFKLVYKQRQLDGSEVAHERTGIIRANPVGRPLRIGALTCQNDYAFPYEPVAHNLLKLDPDLLYFSGDQLYENHGGYGIIREPAGLAILNYLRKFYQHGWAFGEAMRDRPTLCIPDDHDVFQGNIWGEGGAAMKGNDTSSLGGYREPARMVNAVHKTNAAHHPDPYDATSVKQGISVYYGDMVYGGVGFAILADRQFKSAPEHVDTGEGRLDHVEEKDFDTSTLDKPGLDLLGERQEKFLAHWAGDWRGHSMKVLLSQTVFSGLATHHGGFDGYLKADLDSGSWPQTPRNRVVRLLREAMPLHINGDQHLTSLSQYGADEQRDSCWAFCTPAIAVGYPRWWRPDELGEPHAKRPQHGLPDTGEYLDGLGNKTYVYAIGNPIVPTTWNRYERAHQKGSGFGFVTVDTQKKTYFIESFRFSVDATDGDSDNQFPGWPVLIHQEENRGANRLE